MDSEWITSEITFNMNGAPVKWIVVHNKPEKPGMMIEDGFMNWVFRTEDESEITVENFVEYLRGKTPEYTFKIIK